MSDPSGSLGSSPLFENVPTPLVDATLRAGRRRDLAAGDWLLRSGAPNDRLFLILSGHVGVFVAGRDEPHLRLGPGECVGELSIIDPSPVSADVIALEATTVLALQRDAVVELIESSPQAAQNLLRILTRRLRYANTALAAADQTQVELEEAATVDATTGLRNRGWLDSAFERQLSRSRRDHEQVSLLMIDLDGFKQINDAHGHAAGDAVLGQVARCLSEALRPQDLIARYGGDEFAVLLPNLDAADAVSIADRLRQLVQKAPPAPDTPDTAAAGITVSIGVAEATSRGTLADLLAAADRALYRAKRAGRNTIRL